MFTTPCDDAPTKFATRVNAMLYQSFNNANIIAMTNSITLCKTGHSIDNGNARSAYVMQGCNNATMSGANKAINGKCANDALGVMPMAK